MTFEEWWQKPIAKGAMTKQEIHEEVEYLTSLDKVDGIGLSFKAAMRDAFEAGRKIGFEQGKDKGDHEV